MADSKENYILDLGSERVKLYKKKKTFFPAFFCVLATMDERSQKRLNVSCSFLLTGQISL